MLTLSLLMNYFYHMLTLMFLVTSLVFGKRSFGNLATLFGKKGMFLCSKIKYQVLIESFKISNLKARNG